MTATERAELTVRMEHLEQTGRDLSRVLNEEIGANKARERALSERLRRLDQVLVGRLQVHRHGVVHQRLHAGFTEALPQRVPLFGAHHVLVVDVRASFAAAGQPQSRAGQAVRVKAGNLPAALVFRQVRYTKI